MATRSEERNQSSWYEDGNDVNMCPQVPGWEIGRLLEDRESSSTLVQVSLRKRHERREQMMGEGLADAKEGVILNRKAQWTGGGLQLARDPRHVWDFIDELGLERAKPVNTPIPVSQLDKTDRVSTNLSARGCTLFRRLVMARARHSSRLRGDEFGFGGTPNSNSRKKQKTKQKMKKTNESDPRGGRVRGGKPKPKLVTSLGGGGGG